MKRRPFASIAVVPVLALALAAASPAGAAPADLDSSFGAGGVAEVGFFARESGARLAIGPEDSVFVLYSNHPPCEPPFECPVDLGVLRYEADGVRDLAYGTGPGSLLQLRQFTERRAFDLAVGPDGKAVVAAFDQVAGGVTVARFDLGGRLDGTFGAGGRTVETLRTVGDTPVAVGVQADGKIVVAGEGPPYASESAPYDGPRLVLQRYLPNGELDPGFGIGGNATVPLATRSRPADLLLDPAGRVTVAGPICCIGGTPFPAEGFSLVRLLGDGRLDGGLGAAGALFVPTPGAQGAVKAVAPAPDGGLFVSVEEGTETVFTVDNVLKFSPDGSFDQSFGREGGIRLFPRVGALDVTGLAADREGRLIAVGWGEGNAGVARLRPDGSTDRTFNGGLVANAVPGGRALAVGLQSRGRIVVLATKGVGGTPDFVLAALEGGTSRVKCLGRRATIVGTGKQDEITGTPRRDVIAALGAKDKVRGLGGADLICGGKGSDTLLGGAGKDEILQDPHRRSK